MTKSSGCQRNTGFPSFSAISRGLTHDQAASLLRWPLGTVKIRLSGAREQLRTRLQTRGWPSVPLALASRHLPGNTTVISGRLLSSTSEMAAKFTSSAAAGGFVCPTVLTITSGVLRTMWINKLRLAGTILFGVLGLGLGAAVVAQQAPETGLEFMSSRRTHRRTRGRRPIRNQPSRRDCPRPGKVFRIRPRNESRIDKVLVNAGSRVKQGDPLIELTSDELVTAKNEFETASTQHARDKRILDKLAMNASAIPEVRMIEAQSDEAKSVLQMKLSRNRLLALGLNEKEIADIPNEPAAQRGKMVLHAPVDGVILERSAHPGEIAKAVTSLTVYQDDLLLVYTDVSESEINGIGVGQGLTLSLPFDHRTVKAKVQSVSGVDPNTNLIRFSTSIPNPDHRLRPGMFVLVELEKTAKEDGVGRLCCRREVRTEPRCHGPTDAVERKVDKLLKEKEERSSDARIVDRLDQIERKLNQLLDGRNAD